MRRLRVKQGVFLSSNGGRPTSHEPVKGEAGVFLSSNGGRPTSDPRITRGLFNQGLYHQHKVEKTSCDSRNRCKWNPGRLAREVKPGDFSLSLLVQSSWGESNSPVA
eukprot:748884-Pyramimonas_sp.AAC.4